MGKEFWNFKMEKNMRVNGKMIKKMVKESKLTQMVIDMLVNGRIMKPMVKEFWNVKMEKNMRVNGEMVKRMVKELKLI